MSCTDCSPKVVVKYSSPYTATNCSDDNCGTCGNDACNTIYNGADLSCTGVETGTDLQTLLQKFDEKICTITGDYSTYDTHCITGITTEKEFVEAISSQYCTLKSNYDTFTTVTYVADKSAIYSTISDNNIPNITSNCTTYFNPVSTDTVKGVLQKLSNSICSIYSTALDISDVVWDTCYTVTDPPTTIKEGFDTVISQICSLKSTVSATLPTFDNSSNCLSGTSTDTLSDTIEAITTRLCSTPTFDGSDLTFSCVTAPATVTLDSTLQAILSKIDSLSASTAVFDTDYFTTTANGCAGTSVTLSENTFLNNKVAATSSDASPGFLEDKLSAGDNIIIDYTTTPGKATISSTGGSSSSDEKVKAYSTDDTAGYLYDKLSGDSTDDIYINPTEDTTNKQVQLKVDYNAYDLFMALLTELNTLPTSDPLFQLFCAIKNKCPDSCGSVTDVTVTYNS